VWRATLECIICAADYLRNYEHWNANALLGGLLSLKEKETDASQMSTWIHKGRVAFSGDNSKMSKSE